MKYLPIILLLLFTPTMLNADNLLGSISDHADKNKFIVEKLDKLQKDEQEFKIRIEQLDIEIVKKENYIVDVDVLRNTLTEFNEVVETMDDLDRKELYRLLIEEVLYDQENSNIRIMLTQLPDIGVAVNKDGKISFDEGRAWGE